MNKLLEHFKRMQECAAAYLVPETYNARYPAGIHKSAESYSEARDRLFADDILYMLDGPEQREAEDQAAIEETGVVELERILAEIRDTQREQFHNAEQHGAWCIAIATNALTQLAKGSE